MRKVPVQEAVGLTLCHDITAMRDGFKGAAYQRGHVIRQEDVQALLDLGKRHVFIYEQEAGEIHEDDAALRMAALSGVAGAHYTQPSEGKVLLIADQPGLFRVDTRLQKEINAIGDLTISCLPDHYPVTAGARLASMRIVPLVTQLAQIEKAEALAAGRQLFDLLPYRPRKAGVVITGSEVYTGRIKDRFEAVARKKLAPYPCEILGVTLCDDDQDMIVAAARDFIAKGAGLVIFSGGMSVDPDDVTPAAIRALGADIIKYGVPSQPGNMSLVAYLDEVALLGVPGAAISLPTTMFDVFLPQIFAGLRFSREDLINLGEGGLCQLCGECHFPNCTFGRY